MRAERATATLDWAWLIFVKFVHHFFWFYGFTGFIHGVREEQSRFTHRQRRRMRMKHQFRIRDASPDRQPKMESFLVREILQRIMGQNNNDCRSQIFISTNSPTPATFLLVGRKDSRLTYVFSYGIYALDRRSGDGYSVDDLKSSLSVWGLRMADFEVLDARIASALNRIIHNSYFERRVSLEEQKAQKEDRFLRGRQIAFLIYKYFSLEPMILSRIMPTFLLLHLEMTIFRNSYRARFTKQEFWREKWKLWEKRRGQESRDNSVYKEFLETGNGKPTSSVLKEIIAVSVTIFTSVQNCHSRILLQVLSCAKWEKCVENPKSRGKKSQW